MCPIKKAQEERSDLCGRFQAYLLSCPLFFPRLRPTPCRKSYPRTAAQKSERYRISKGNIPQEKHLHEKFQVTPKPQQIHTPYLHTSLVEQYLNICHIQVKLQISRLSLESTTRSGYAGLCSHTAAVVRNKWWLHSHDGAGVVQVTGSLQVSLSFPGDRLTISGNCQN